MTMAVEENQPTEKDVTQEKSYWNSFYSSMFSVAIPSQFCVSTAFDLTSTNKTKSVVEFGCGNGRDSLYMASQGFNVYACDLSIEAIDASKEKAAKYLNGEMACAGSITFEPVDATNAEQVQSIIQKARTESASDVVAVYTRFFLHSIDEEQEDLFVSALATALTVSGDEIHSEYRSAEDESLPKVHGKGHYRRYIQTPVLLKKLEALGFEVIYDVTGRGMAKYKNEDPFVSRFIVRKSD